MSGVCLAFYGYIIEFLYLKILYFEQISRSLVSSRVGYACLMQQKCINLNKKFNLHNNKTIERRDRILNLFLLIFAYSSSVVKLLVTI